MARPGKGDVEEPDVLTPLFVAVQTRNGGRSPVLPVHPTSMVRALWLSGSWNSGICGLGLYTSHR